MQRVLGIGLAWGVLWLVVTTALGAVIGIVDPDSIDPGDWQGMISVFGSMGFLSGVAFGILASFAKRDSPTFAQSVPRSALRGMLGTGVVQLGYLDHGDAGLRANLYMALVLCAFGGVIAVIWLLLSRRWASWRSAVPVPSSSTHLGE